MGQRKHNRTAGFSLIEVVVGIALLGLVTAPVCASLVLSVRLNAHSRALMEARLQASGVVETLLAEGIDTKDTDWTVTKTRTEGDQTIDCGWKMKDTVSPQGVSVKVEEVPGKSYYAVTVTSSVAVDGNYETVILETSVRAAPQEGGDA